MAGATLRGRLTWLLGDVVEVADGPPGVRTIALDCPGWQGHLPGQHVDIRLTAEDGYQAQRSYSIAAPADGDRVELTVERLDDGEVSPYLTDELSPGSGIFIEELAAELSDRGVPMPRATGVTHQLPDHDPAAERGSIVELTGGARGR